jgi:hypothetical protein
MSEHPVRRGTNGTYLRCAAMVLTAMVVKYAVMFAVEPCALERESSWP